MSDTEFTFDLTITEVGWKEIKEKYLPPQGVFKWQPQGAEMNTDWDRVFVVGNTVSLEVAGKWYNFTVTGKDGDGYILELVQ